jgi:hypothetical protein
VRKGTHDASIEHQSMTTRECVSILPVCIVPVRLETEGYDRLRRDVAITGGSF